MSMYTPSFRRLKTARSTHDKDTTRTKLLPPPSLPPEMMLKSVGAVMVTAAFLLCAGGGAAQQYDTGFASTCDMSTLFARVDSLTTECCSLGDAGSCGSSPCTVDCLSALLPLLDDCRDVMNRLFDGEDGVYDGEAASFSNQYDQCAATPPASLIDELKALQDRGQCPPTVLDDVAATEVKAPGCADRWDGDRCSLSIASGIMTCEHDFCNTVYPPCVMAGQCDRSCGLCGADDGGGHRRLLAMLGKLRRLQMSHMTCDPATFSSQAATVDAACCDDDQSCTDGLPGECDAKCAVVFNSFYPRCQRFLASQFSLAQMAGYDQLFSTCTRALPTEPLLRALVVCSANPPDPCFDVDCGDHGSCDDGTCQCEQGYSGESCGAFDPCAGVDCGSEGSCANGHCTILGTVWFAGVNDQSCDSVCGDQGLRCRGESFQALVDAGDATVRSIAAATNVDCQLIVQIDDHSISPWFRDLAVLPDDHRCFYGAGGTCGGHSSNNDLRMCPCA
eukprot:SAG22_NODE_2539_length_2463_cov_16.648054_2_plen_504_part_00